MNYFDLLYAKKLGGGGFTPTEEQLTAMNSGIDSEKVEQISNNEADILSLSAKVEALVSEDDGVKHATFIANNVAITDMNLIVTSSTVITELGVQSFSRDVKVLGITGYFYPYVFDEREEVAILSDIRHQIGSSAHYIKTAQGSYHDNSFGICITSSGDILTAINYFYDPGMKAYTIVPDPNYGYMKACIYVTLIYKMAE